MRVLANVVAPPPPPPPPRGARPSARPGQAHPHLTSPSVSPPSAGGDRAVVAPGCKQYPPRDGAGARTGKDTSERGRSVRVRSDRSGKTAKAAAGQPAQARSTRRGGGGRGRQDGLNASQETWLAGNDGEPPG
ncbi:hypothetical protein PCL_08242 [Purpureocillium lilacinum]|uniref:Uncharacterized protein n=1 Tax=Purpureocillium lilacinum TaxID=33203 RepID=A0A2U3EK87_PURLI|nr:hypothetical protein PCL_08242 [Purpureocillium lilacinum]